MTTELDGKLACGDTETNYLLATAITAASLRDDWIYTDTRLFVEFRTQRFQGIARKASSAMGA